MWTKLLNEDHKTQDRRWWTCYHPIIKICIFKKDFGLGDGENKLMLYLGNVKGTKRIPLLHSSLWCQSPHGVPQDGCGQGSVGSTFQGEHDRQDTNLKAFFIMQVKLASDQWLSKQGLRPWILPFAHPLRESHPKLKWLKKILKHLLWAFNTYM